MKVLLPVLLLVAGLSACSDPDRFYEEHRDLPASGWKRDSLLQFEFAVEDTTRSYLFSTPIRQEERYEFHNFYYSYALFGPEDSLLRSGLIVCSFSDPVSGEPYGNTAGGDLIDHHFPIPDLFGVKFSRTGIYRLAIGQFVRNRDPLRFISSMGLRVAFADQEPTTLRLP